MTGWLLATLEPRNVTRSVPIRSVYEQVVAATPSVGLRPKVLGEWQIRAELSMLFVPMARTAFWAT